MIEGIGHAVYPPPAEISQLATQLTDAMANEDQGALVEIQSKLEVAMSAYLETAPVGAMLFVVLAWIGSAFFGGLAAAATAPVTRLPMALFIGIIDVFGIMTVSLQFKHPVWMPVIGMVGAILMSLLAGWLVSRRIRSTAPEPAA
ncbi:MAG: hypothetical protein CMJ34_05835 [Phycisphaerae bacterium]|nr:hypothetical protein [Phycisphaerae bacterium]